jgi:hypothetical protein
VLLRVYSLETLVKVERVGLKNDLYYDLTSIENFG